MSKNAAGDPPWSFANIPQQGKLSIPGYGAIMNGPNNTSLNVHYDNAQNALHVKGNVVIEDEDGTKVDVAKTLLGIEQRLAILNPDFAAIEEFQALRDAYEQYKVLEKLLLEGRKKDGN